MYTNYLVNVLPTSITWGIYIMGLLITLTMIYIVVCILVSQDD